MVHSMTAFARVEQAGTHGTLSWELRSVNHRYLEPHLRLPDAFRDLEGAVREALRQGLSRGKVECTLRFAEETAGKSLQVDQERARQLVAAAEGVAALIRQPAPLDPLAVLAWPGVLVADSADPQALNAAALEAFGQALEQLKAGRSREGQELAKLLNDRLDAMLVEVGNLRELVPTMLANQRQKILDRFAELKAELDPQRLEQELVLLAQKSDVAEELDRLATHVGEVRRVLKAGGAPPGPQGRRRRRSAPGLPDAGTQPGSQHSRLQGVRPALDPGGGQPQGPDRADARAGPEHRMTGGRLRPISFQPVRSTRNTSCPAPCTSFPLPPAPARPAW